MCQKKNFAKLKTNLLLVGKDAVQNKAAKNHRSSGVSKTCEACNKRYIYSHKKCPKRPTAPQSNTDCPFNFSDSIFNKDAFEKAKEFGFDFETTSIPESFDFLNASESEGAATWINKLDSFAARHTNNIKILHININSVFCKLYELNLILNKLYFNFVFVQETKLGPDLPDLFISNKSYGLVRCDRKAGGGGLLVYHKKSYTILNPIIDSDFETITFSVILNKTKHTFVSSYNPHFKHTPIFLSFLESHIKSLIAQNHRNVTLIGDLNQDLLTSNGDKLKSLMESFNFKSYQNEPTRLAKTSSTCIDVVFSNTSSLIESVETFRAPFSDHNFVVLALNGKQTRESPSTVESRSLTPSKLDLIDKALQSAPFSLIHSDVLGSTDDKFFTFKKLIIDVLDSIAPMKTIRIKNNNLPWVDTEMRRLFQERDRYLKR